MKNQFKRRDFVKTVSAGVAGIGLMNSTFAISFKNQNKVQAGSLSALVKAVACEVSRPIIPTLCPACTLF